MAAVPGLPVAPASQREITGGPALLGGHTTPLEGQEMKTGGQEETKDGFFPVGSGP